MVETVGFLAPPVTCSGQRGSEASVRTQIARRTADGVEVRDDAHVLCGESVDVTDSVT